jgi:hypothetical protein
MGVACVAPPRLLLVGMLSASKCSAGRACASVGRTRALGLTRTGTGRRVAYRALATCRATPPERLHLRRTPETSRDIAYVHT